MSTVTVNEQELHYTDTGGDGPAVVFSHGALLDSAMWDETVRGLGAGVRAVALDARLHGQTPGTGTDFTFWDSARDLLGLLDALGIGRAVLAGHSQGGFTALRAALLAPERVSGLIMADTMAAPWPPEAVGQLNGARDGLATAGPDAVAPGLLPALVGGAPRYGTWLTRWQAQGGQRLAAALQVLLSADDVTARLAEISAPALVVHAEDDPVIPLAAGRALRDALSRADLAVIPGAAVHAPVLTHPEIVIPAIKKFLEQLIPDGGH